jgi:uncharacterized protein YegL
MTSLQRVTARAVAGLAAIGLALAPTAALAAEGSIAHVETKPGSVQLLVSVPADAEVDLDGVTVTVDGKNASATAETAGTDTTVRRTAVMAIDTSNSMKGSRFEAAKVAAQEFISSVPADVYVGIVTFAGEVTTVLDPTTNHAAAKAVLDGLTLTRKTRLYDGVIQAVDVAGTEGQRSLLVLSDGADTSATPIDAATTKIQDAEVLVDVVALEQNGTALEALQQLATAGEGQVISSDPAALQAAFAAEADVLARQVLVTATLPSGFDKTEATIKVTLPTSTGSVTAEAFSAVEPGSQELVRSRSWTPPSWALYAGPAALALGLLFFVVLLVPRKQAHLSAADRVTRYTEIQAAGGSTAEGGPLFDADVTFASAKETAANVLRRNKDLDARISSRLQGAGSELKSSEWLLVHGGLFFLSGLTGLLLGGGRTVRPLDVPRLPAQPAPQGVQLGSARHAAADVRLARRGSLPGPVDRHDRPRGCRADRLRVPPGAGGDPARRLPRGRHGGRRRAVRQQGLRMGRHGHQDPATGRRQPGRAPRHGGGHDARARVRPSPGRRTGRRRKALGMGVGRPSAALHGLPSVDELRLRHRHVQGASGLGDAGRRGNHPWHRGFLDESTGQGGGVRWPFSSF